MKTKKNLFMLATLFSAVIGFTACSSEDDLASSEQESGAVKVDFTISFPKQMSGYTRQSETIVQGQTSPVFRGITGIKLMPFSSAKENISGSTNLPSSISLAGGTVGKSGASGTSANVIAADGALYGGSNSHLYKNIEIAIGTRAFMFYGYAIPADAATGSTANGTNGALQETVATTGTSQKLSDVSFNLVNIYSASATDAQATDIAAYLTDIAKASSGTETMLTYFPNFTDLEAGSWENMKAVVQAVYTSLYNNTDALSEAIKTTILTGYTPTGGTQTITVTDNGGTGGASTGTLAFTTSYNYSYPRNHYLPDGAAHITWDTTNLRFNVVTTDNMGLNVSTLNTYTYPASLYYFGLSNIWAVPASMEDSYTETATWANIVKAYTDRTDETPTVQSTTRSIAIIDEVQYAVGRLDVTVKSKNGAETLTDKAGTIIALGDNGANFPITGILVANQKAVDYAFATKTSADAKIIYDNQMPSGATLFPGTTPTTKTHTLVLQTIDAGSNDDSNADVPIAIEFENKGTQIIVGNDNKLIYPGTRFYLVGTLHPYKNSSQTYDGSTADETNHPDLIIKKAFVQDYITTANFTVESFQKAYNTLPDLRIPHLEVGLSVDLDWKPGITQSITIE